MDDLTKTISTRVKSRREALGWNQSQLAQRLGISSSSINQYESAVKRPSTEILLKMAGVLGVSTDYLFGSSDEKKFFFDAEVADLFAEYQALQPRDRKVVLEVIKALKLIDDV